MQPRRADTRSIRRSIYMLKRSYGFPLVLYTILSEEADLETGRKRPTYSFLNVQRGVILPDATAWQFIAPAKQYTPRGLFAQGTRAILIDWQDVRDYEITVDSHVVYDGKDYVVSNVQEYELQTAYILNVKAVDGSEVVDPSRPDVVDTITFSDTVTEEVV